MIYLLVGNFQTNKQKTKIQRNYMDTVTKDFLNDKIMRFVRTHIV